MRTLFLLLITAAALAQPQPGYWQQQVDYTMEVDMDVKTFRYSGTQELVYTNKSPDTLKRVFYHLYFNAFQPGSEMDIRSLSLRDPDARVGSRIGKLNKKEVGYLHATSITQDGKALSFEEEETILVVPLAKPLPPNASTTLSMVFEGQVPKLQNLGNFICNWGTGMANSYSPKPGLKQQRPNKFQIPGTHPA